MRKEIKKVLTLSALVFGTVFLAGCGNSQTSSNSNVPPVATPNPGIAKNSTDSALDTTAPAVDTSGLPTPPAPTGKVDDTVNAIEDGAKNEGAQATSDGGDAQAATDNSTNSQAANDLGAGL